MECFLEHLCVFSALNSTTLTLPYPNNENHIIHSSDKPDYNVTQNLLLILHGSTFFLCFFLFFFFLKLQVIWWEGAGGCGWDAGERGGLSKSIIFSVIDMYKA